MPFVKRKDDVEETHETASDKIRIEEKKMKDSEV